MHPCVSPCVKMYGRYLFDSKNKKQLIVRLLHRDGDESRRLVTLRRRQTRQHYYKFIYR